MTDLRLFRFDFGTTGEIRQSFLDSSEPKLSGVRTTEQFLVFEIEEDNLRHVIKRRSARNLIQEEEFLTHLRNEQDVLARLGLNPEPT
jgi:hypothetical protein